MSDTYKEQEINLPPGFHYGDVDYRPNPPPRKEVDPPLGVLEKFSGVFTGTGFNTIFRPNSVAPTTTTFPNAVNPPPPAPPNEAVLQLNLTTEELSFSAPLGSVPNRGLNTQNDIFLNGVPYLQTINDVSNTATGRPDGEATGIHTETGMFMAVPATANNPVLGETIVRMGSIPHGTTINAQSKAAFTTQGAPPIGPQDITPFPIGNPSGLIHFASQDAANVNTARLPQDLSLFIAEGTITQDILTNPVTILTSINDQINITETTTFILDTKSDTADAASPPGGGTANIAFLVGSNPGGNPNAVASQMKAIFWVETVAAEITIPSFTPGKNQVPLLFKPELKSAGGKPIPPLPTFSVTPPGPITEPKTLTVTYTQIQYVQNVALDFNGLTWPHLSLATLVPRDPIVVPDSAFEAAAAK